MPTRAPRIAWQKRLMFHSLMLVLVTVILEGASLSILILTQGSWAQLVALRTKMEVQNPFNPGGSFQAPIVIHPYLGVVMQPKVDGGQLTIDGKYRITEYGFVDDVMPIHKRSLDHVIVAFLGGSVARQLSTNVSDRLALELSAIPEFSGRTFTFVRLASNGYKQPQQLMTLSYLLTLGAEFDVVINLDGFNEAALPAIDNVPLGVFAAYPRDWGKLIASNISPEFNRMGGYISYLRKGQCDDALSASSFPWNCSPTAQLIWSLRNQRRDRQIFVQAESMNRFTEEQIPFCRSGPPQKFDSPEQIYEHCTEIWSRSSLMIHQLCLARGIRYFHFLQPNQYLEGTKPIGPEETILAIRSDHPYCAAVQSCFPRMRIAGTRLSEQGVSFFDLTDVFIDHPEPLYLDSCCHVNRAGDLLMASAIAAQIRQTINHN